MKRYRGITVGAVVATVVITTIVILGIYQIMRAYTAGYTALSEYGIQTQKPVFKGESVLLYNNTHVLITLVNEGPVGAQVNRVHIYVHDPVSGIPSSTDEYPVNRYISVGGKVEIYVNVDSLLRYMAGDKPIRFAVETDKGPVLASISTVRGTLRINVMLPPTYTASVDDATILVTCPPKSNLPYFRYIIRPQTVIPRGFTLFTDEKVISISGEIPALTACLVEFSAKLRNIRLVEGRWTVDKIPSAYFYSGIQNVTYKALADIKPGGVAVVDINIPDLLSNRDTIAPANQMGAQVIDFSWFFVSYLTDASARAVLSTGEKWEGTDYGVEPHPYSLTRAILTNGAIEAVSPLGCTIYPLASATPPSGLLEPWAWYVFKTSELSYSFYEYAYHTGPTIVIPKPFDSGNCPITPGVGTTVLRVSVPFELFESRRYLIIPVFTYDDKDDFNHFMATISITVTNSRGTIKASYTVTEPPLGSGTNPLGWEYIGPTQLAPPLIVDSDDSGVWRVNIEIVNSGVRDRNKVEWLRVIVSKVVIIPLVGSPAAFCTIDASGEPMFPFADVRFNPTSVSRNVPLLLRLEPRLRNVVDSGTTQEFDRLVFYYAGERSRTVYVTGQNGLCPTIVGSNTITNIRAPTYCASSTSVTINFMDTSNNPASALLIPYVDDQNDPYSDVVAYNILDYFTTSTFTSYVLYDKPMIGVYVYYIVDNSRQWLQFTITAPSFGSWVAIIPFSTYTVLNSPPFPTNPISVRVTRVQGTSETDGIVEYVSRDPAAAWGVAHVYFTGSQATIRLYLPRHDARTYYDIYFFVQAVILAPIYDNIAVATPQRTNTNLVRTGIRVFNISSSVSGDIIFRLVRKSDNKLLGVWTYSGPTPRDLLLPVNGMYVSLEYDLLAKWYRELVERPQPKDYLLIIQNARC